MYLIQRYIPSRFLSGIREDSTLSVLHARGQKAVSSIIQAFKGELAKIKGYMY